MQLVGNYFATLGGKNSPKETLKTHSMGIWIFLTCATFPSNIKTIKMVGNIPIKFSDLLLIFILLISLNSRRTNVEILPILCTIFFLITPSILGIMGDPDASIFISDFEGPLYFFCAYYLFRLQLSPKNIKVLSKYILSTLITSAVIQYLILKGALTFPLPLRASFSSGSQENIGRLVTNTLPLAAVTISISMTLYFRKIVNLRICLLYIIPSLLIALYAGTRFVSVFIFFPIVYYFFSRKGNENPLGNARVFGVILVIPILGSIMQTVFQANDFLSKYLNNTIARLFLSLSNGFGTSDGSTSYRILETHRVSEAFLLRPVLGYGYGNSYTAPFFFGNSRDWLTVYGNYYTHSTYSWILIKGGLMGFVLLFIWLFRLLRLKNQNKLLLHILKPALMSIIITGIVWNYLASTSEASVFGMLIGLAASLKAHEKNYA